VSAAGFFGRETQAATDFQEDRIVSQATYKVIGTRPIRHDGIEKVTGRALYGADVQMAGLLHGRVLRSPHAHAHIRKIDVKKALAMPGVEAVVTSADLHDPGSHVVELGEGAINLRHLSCNILAREKALYQGHAVAAVAAVSPHIAEEALALIRVDYEVLPPVIDVVDAMKDGSALLHPDLVTESLAGPGKPSNIAKHFQFKLGDLQKGLAEAAVVCERSFHTATVHQGYIEPHNATALYGTDGNLNGAGPGGGTLGHSDLAHQGGADGNRRRLRRQDPGLPRTGGGPLEPEDRPARQGAHEPGRGVRRDRSHAGLIHQGQDGGRQVG
jgi:xanthine dehydrogenase molybdopterin-binding subunit B